MSDRRSPSVQTTAPAQAVPTAQAVPAPGAHEDLLDHLVRSTPLSRGEAGRVVWDVLAYFGETAEEFVRRRHRELRSEGLRNPAIFARIEAELPHRVVAPPELSLRQLRRIVYG